MLNKNKILMLAVVGVITNLSSDAKSQTFYQCMPKKCGANEILGSNGNCYNANDVNNWILHYNINNSVKTGLLFDAGTYVVTIKGAAGGFGGKATGTRGNFGGSVVYKFTMDKSWAFSCGIGTSGVIDENTPYWSYGGGGGSWVSIDDQYIVAGGGGGKSTKTSCTSHGAGGAVGGGSSGKQLINYVNDCKYLSGWNQSAYVGGFSGNYAGGSVKYTSDQCYIYNYEDDDDTYACYPGKGINNANGGQCPLRNISEIAQGGSAEGIQLYPGFGNIKVGGDACESGTATHKSNISGIPLCSSDGSNGCVSIYKFKY